MRVFRTAAAAAAAALALAGAVAGCGLTAPEEDSIVHKRSLTIGVKADQPGLGLLERGTYRGFDVDVALYVAAKLGVPADRVTFKTTQSSEREQVLRDGKVDMIFATYSITPKRKREVTFAGPYYVAHQDTLVRADEKTIRNVRTLGGRKICAVKGSNSWRRVTEERKVAAKPVEAANYGECMTKLSAGQVDAVSTDDLILAGLAATGPQVRIVNAPFTDEKYGVGLKKGDLAGCEAVNQALTEMYQTRKAPAFLDKWFGKSGLRPTYSVPQYEGCS